jgi:hypothetical protein
MIGEPLNLVPTLGRTVVLVGWSIASSCLAATTRVPAVEGFDMIAGVAEPRTVREVTTTNPFLPKTR